MPTVSISHELELNYICNAPSNDPLRFDHSRPTIVLLHGCWVDSSWLKYHFNDPRLVDHYNLIGFDARACGQTKSPILPSRDSWVDASDLAVALSLLGIQKCHIFAIQCTSVHAAYRFALLYPEMTLSLCLCQLPANVEPDWVLQAHEELIEAMCFPPDLETIERAYIETNYLLFSGMLTPDQSDEICAYWQTQFPATKRINTIQSSLPISQRVSLTDSMFKRLQMPILVLQGEKYVTSPIYQAEEEVSKMPHGQLLIVRGGPESFTLVPSCATVVNRVYSTFLSRLPAYQPFIPVIRSKERTYALGLQRLSQIFEDPSISQREPIDASFSMISPEKIAEIAAILAHFEKDQDKALTALDSDGRPIKRISEVKDDQGFRDRTGRMLDVALTYQFDEIVKS